jgi:uncharacterized protein YbjT (DUF2867 family)
VRVVLFGASGMVGQGVLRECLLDPGVEAVLSVGRSALTPEQRWPALDSGVKLIELTVPDLSDYLAVEAKLGGYDACFFSLGVSSAGMKEEEYRRITYGFTLSAAETLVRLNPALTFVYVSGAGTDSTAQGRTMWARVKGETENALLRLPFKAAYMFRPGVIQPLHGIRSKTSSYRIFYAVLGPMLSAVRAIAPRMITTTAQIGRAMLHVAREGYPKTVLEAGDIARV